ncbi:hypothetical protein D3C85_1263520 [compost metagenome]
MFGNEALVFEYVWNDHQVDLVRHQLVAQDCAGVDMGLDDHAGIGRLDRADQARQPCHRGELGHADPDMAFHHLWPLELFDRSVPLVEQPFCQQEHLFAFLGQAGRAQCAVKEGCFKQGLQFLDPLGYGRLRRVQSFRCLREAAELDYPIDGLQLFESDHAYARLQKKIVFKNPKRFQFIAFFDLTLTSKFAFTKSF